MNNSIELFFKQLENFDAISFNSIPKNTMHETSVTDLILSAIMNWSQDSGIITFDESYKETGDRTVNPKKGTSADFLLVLRDKSGLPHNISFQAKLGKLSKNIGNEYSEIIHTIGNKSNADYQIDRYNDFLKDNPDIVGKYIFYNGNYPDASNQADIALLDNSSFWILDIANVKILVGNDYKVIGLHDVVGIPDHTKFIEYLRGFSK
jgi:hypothetical protein